MAVRAIPPFLLLGHMALAVARGLALLLAVPVRGLPLARGVAVGELPLVGGVLPVGRGGAVAVPGPPVGRDARDGRSGVCRHGDVILTVVQLLRLQLEAVCVVLLVLVPLLLLPLLLLGHIVVLRARCSIVRLLLLPLLRGRRRRLGCCRLLQVRRHRRQAVGRCWLGSRWRRCSIRCLLVALMLAIPLQLVGWGRLAVGMCLLLRPVRLLRLKPCRRCCRLSGRLRRLRRRLRCSLAFALGGPGDRQHPAARARCPGCQLGAVGCCAVGVAAAGRGSPLGAGRWRSIGAKPCTRAALAALRRLPAGLRSVGGDAGRKAGRQRRRGGRPLLLRLWHRRLGVRRRLPLALGHADRPLAAAVGLLLLGRGRRRRSSSRRHRPLWGLRGAGAGEGAERRRLGRLLLLLLLCLICMLLILGRLVRLRCRSCRGQRGELRGVFRLHGRAGRGRREQRGAGEEGAATRSESATPLAPLAPPCLA